VLNWVNLCRVTSGMKKQSQSIALVRAPLSKDARSTHFHRQVRRNLLFASLSPRTVELCQFLLVFVHFCMFLLRFVGFRAPFDPIHADI
jgi:hypothetical protein